MHVSELPTVEFDTGISPRNGKLRATKVKARRLTGPAYLSCTRAWARRQAARSEGAWQ